MGAVRQSTVNLTKNAQEIKDRLSPGLGLKGILSVGLELFDKLSDKEKIERVGLALVGDKRGRNDQKPRRVGEAVEPNAQSLRDAIKQIVATTKAKEQTPAMIIHISPHDKDAWDALEQIAREQRGAETPKKKKQTG